jgi:phosphoenolpyruvate carboxylase
MVAYFIVEEKKGMEIHLEVERLTFAFPLYSFQVTADVQEVLDTFRVAAELGSDALGAYVISMASNVCRYASLM